MSLLFKKYVLGPLSTNTYLLFDELSKEAALIDPAIGSEQILKYLRDKELYLKAIWITHAHFDHYAGVPFYQKTLGYEIPIGLHKNDLFLWRQGGGAGTLGYTLPPGPEPVFSLVPGQNLKLGEKDQIQVIHTPGHSPGHVVFYCPQIQIVFCGDLIFKNGIGRTDLPGGSMDQLTNSVLSKIFTLPSETRLYCGHGLDTTISCEIKYNPYLM